MLHETMPSRLRYPLVLLPGLDGTDVLYRPLLHLLKERADARVVQYPTSGPCDYEAALAHATEALRSTGPCHLVAWSFSGPVALQAARLEPELVRSLTLIATFVEAPLPWLRVARPLLVQPIIGAARMLRRLPIWLGRAPRDPLRVAKAEIWQRVGARTLTARLRAIQRVDAREHLRAVAQPLQYIRCCDDRVVPRRNMEQVLSLRADVEIIEVPGDHFALFGEPAASAAAIECFCRRNDATGRLPRELGSAPPAR